MVDTASQPILDDYDQGFWAGILVAVSALAALSLLFAIYSCCFRQPEKQVQDAGQSDGVSETTGEEEAAEVGNRREEGVERSMVRSSANKEMSEFGKVEVTAEALQEARFLLKQNCSKTKEVVAAHQSGEIKELKSISESVGNRVSALGSGKPFVRNPPASSKDFAGSGLIPGAMSLSLPVEVGRSNSASDVDGSPSSEGKRENFPQSVIDGVQCAANITRKSATQFSGSLFNRKNNSSETKSEDSSSEGSEQYSQGEGQAAQGAQNIERACLFNRLANHGISSVKRLVGGGPLTTIKDESLSVSDKVRNFELLLSCLLELSWPESLESQNRTFQGLMEHLQIFNVGYLNFRKSRVDQGNRKSGRSDSSHSEGNSVWSKGKAMFSSWGNRRRGSSENPVFTAEYLATFDGSSHNKSDSPPPALGDVDPWTFLQAELTQFGVIFSSSGEEPFKSPDAMGEYGDEDIADLRDRVVALWECVNPSQAKNFCNATLPPCSQQPEFSGLMRKAPSA